MIYIDESMSKWINKWTHPKFTVVPRKPCPCGNEYNSIYFSLTGVLYHVEIFESKADPPPQWPWKEYNKKGKILDFSYNEPNPFM